MGLFENSLRETFGLNDEDLSMIKSLFSEEKLSKNDSYCKKSTHFNKLSYIKSGYLRIHNQVNGREITQWISGPGYFITELSSFMFDQRSKWNITALTEVELLTIEKENYKQLRDSINDWDLIEKRFIAHCFMTLEERVNQLLALNAEQRVLAFQENYEELFHYVPLQNIASLLGISPETLSRIRSKIV